MIAKKGKVELYFGILVLITSYSFGVFGVCKLTNKKIKILYLKWRIAKVDKYVGTLCSSVLVAMLSVVAQCLYIKNVFKVNKPSYSKSTIKFKVKYTNLTHDTDEQ